MGFMQPQADHFTMLVIETSAGTEAVPRDIVGPTRDPADLVDYLEGEAEEEAEIEEQTGWWARLSAPGYLDCTSWDGPHATEEDALKALAELHDICPRCYENCEDGPAGECPEYVLAAS